MINLKTVWGVLITGVAIMSGVLSIVREVLHFVDPAKFPERSIFFASVRVAFLVAVGVLWWQEKRARIVAETLLDRSKPHFELSLGQHIWQYRQDLDLTCFYFLTGLLNRGEPSVALSWNARYILNRHPEPMEIFQIASPHTIAIDDRVVTFTNENLLNVKTLERPVLKGQWIGGRMLLTLPGNRSLQLQAAQFKVELSCSDYAGTTYSAEYVPSGAPARTLLTHFAEHVQPRDGELPPAPDAAAGFEQGRAD